MNHSTQPAGRHRNLIAVAASVVLALAAAVVLVVGTHNSAGPPQPPRYAGSSPSVATSATAVPRGTSPAQDPDLGPILAASRPVALDIPSVGVHTSRFVDLGRAADGSLQVPQDFSAVGWYTLGPTPGQLGPAILAAHVDSQNGPAVFYRLGALRPGALVTVARLDGSTASFTVDRVQRFAKDQFPTVLVYGRTSRAELRLITCGGAFDPKTGHYLDNVVAFAHLRR